MDPKGKGREFQNLNAVHVKDIPYKVLLDAQYGRASAKYLTLISDKKVRFS